MDGRIRKAGLRKVGLAGLVVGGTLLFGVGLAGAQSSGGGDGDGVVRNPSSLNAHTSPSDVIIGGSGGCHGDGGVTGAVVSQIDL